jgi:anthraniloyl-CoA monooxygenase
VAAHQDDLELAFTNYEAERQPQVAKIQNQARGGLSWWEHFARYYNSFDPTQFTFHFFSRSIDIDKIRMRDPELVASAEQDWLDRHGHAPLETPLRAGTTELGGRSLTLSAEGADIVLAGPGGSMALVADPTQANSKTALLMTAPETEAGLASAFAKLPAEAAAVVIQGGNAFTRILLSEEARLGRGLTSVIVDDRGPASNLTLVLSGRADAVATANGGAIDA